MLDETPPQGEAESGGGSDRLLETLSAHFSESSRLEEIGQIAGVAIQDTVRMSASPSEAWASLVLAAKRSGRFLDLCAVLLHHAASETVQRELMTAFADNASWVAAICMSRYGLPPSAGAAEGVRDLLRLTPPGQLDALDAITSVAHPLDDAVARAQAIVDVLRRTAMIEVGGNAVGTAVLVAPDMLLTAAHVIGARFLTPRILSQTWAVFDFYANGCSQAETGTRVLVQHLLYASPPTRAELAGESDAWEASADHLDYALLRLAHPPSVPPRGLGEGVRGYYPLDETTYSLDQSTRLVLAQHPLGDFLKLSDIVTEAWYNSSATRMRYHCNTLQGASGGPLIDHRGRLVAVHHFSTGRTNQAVPTSAICQSLRRAGILVGRGAMALDAPVHLGAYSDDARDRVVAGIGEGFSSVARVVRAPDDIVNARGMWEWLASSRKLHRLRGALLGVGLTELVAVLDEDIRSSANRSSAYAIPVEQLADHTREIGEAIKLLRVGMRPADMVARATAPRHLAQAILDQLEVISGVRSDGGLSISIRMTAHASIVEMRDNAMRLLSMLPASIKEARDAEDRVEDIVDSARELELAAASLYGALGNGPNPS